MSVYTCVLSPQSCRHVFTPLSHSEVITVLTAFITVSLPQPLFNDYLKSAEEPGFTVINCDQRLFPLFSRMANIPFNEFDIEKPLGSADGSVIQVFNMLTEFRLFDIMNDLVTFFKYRPILYFISA